VRFAPRRPPARRVLEACAVLAVAIVPALVFTQNAPHGQLSWVVPPTPGLVEHFVDVSMGLNAAAGLAAVCGLGVLARGALRGRRDQLWLLCLVGGWILLPVVLGLLVSQDQPIMNPRYSVVMAPGIALAGAYGLAVLGRSHRALAALALAGILAVSAVEIAHWYGRSVENWQAAAAYVARGRAPGDSVLVAPRYELDAYRYYAPATPIGLASPLRRTFVIVGNAGASLVTAHSEPPLASARHALGAAFSRLRLVSMKSFGADLDVIVFAPR